MNWVFVSLLVIIFSTLAASLSNELIAKVKNFYENTEPRVMSTILGEILEEYITNPKENIFEHYMYGRPNPCTHYAKFNQVFYKYTKVEMKVILAAKKSWPVTLDGETYFPVPVLLLCEQSSLLEGIMGYFTLMLLDPKLHTFIQVNDYPWSGIDGAKAPIEIVNARLLEVNYFDHGRNARNFLNIIQGNETDIFQICELLRKYDHFIASTYRVSKAGVKIQDYVFYLNKMKKLNIPGVVYCEIEYNANVTKVFKNIAPGTKEVLYYIPNRPLIDMMLNEEIKPLEFFKAKHLHIEADGKEALVWN